MYVFSRRAADALAACPRGSWLACPNKYFVDVNSATTQRRQAGSCVTFGHTLNNEDFLVGACMAEAMIFPRTHECVVSQAGRPRHKDSPVVRAWRLQKRCLCPISVHSIKDRVLLLRAKAKVQRDCDAVI